MISKGREDLYIGIFRRTTDFVSQISMPPKRKRVASSKPSSSKRRRSNRDSDSNDDFEDDKQRHEFGAPSKDDDRLAMSTAASIATHATRATRLTTIPGLTTLAMRVAARDVQVLFGYKHQKRTARLIDEVPPHLVSRLFGHFRVQHPELLNHNLIRDVRARVQRCMCECAKLRYILQHFLRGPEIILTGDLPGVRHGTISVLRTRASGDLKVLELSGLDKDTLSDTKTDSKLFDNMHELETLVLR